MSTAKIKITRLREIAALPNNECADALRVYLGSITIDERRAAVAKRFVKPTEEEVRQYCLERGNSVDAVAFCAYYESKGWLVGKSPMRDWRAAVRTWEIRERQNNVNNNGNNRKNNYFGQRKVCATSITDIDRIVQDGERLAAVFRHADK